MDSLLLPIRTCIPASGIVENIVRTYRPPYGRSVASDRRYAARRLPGPVPSHPVRPMRSSGDVAVFPVPPLFRPEFAPLCVGPAPHTDYSPVSDSRTSTASPPASRRRQPTPEKSDPRLIDQQRVQRIRNADARRRAATSSAPDKSFLRSLKTYTAPI